MEKKKKSAESVKKIRCISPENLSAELDGEYTFTAAEKQHLEICRKCKDLYESYKIIDDAASHSLNVKVPQLTIDRIHKNLRHCLNIPDPSQEKHPFHFLAWAGRIAATVVLVGAAAYLFLNDRHFSKPKTSVPVAEAPLTLPESNSSLNTVSDSQPGFTGGVDIRNLQLAATGETNPVEFAGNNTGKQSKPDRIALIPARVKHVWLFDSSKKNTDIESLFRNALLKAKIPLKDIKLKIGSDGALHADLELTRYQAVCLVRELAAKKLQLVSPEQPQPEQKLFAGSGRELLDYQIVLMPHGK